MLLAAGSPAIGAEKLSWEESIRRAAEGNYELRGARESLSSSEFLKSQAISGYLPQLSGSLGYIKSSTQIIGTSELGGAGSTTGTGGTTAIGSSLSNPSTTQYSAALNLTQNLFSGFQDTGRLNQARANATTAQAAFATAKAKVSYDLKSAYQGLIYAQELERLAQSIITRRQDNLRLVELRFESGRENKGSVLLSEAYLAQARLEALQAGNAMQLAREQLARVLGDESIASAEVRASGAIPVAEPDLSVDLRQLAVTTPDHLQAVAQEDSAQAVLQQSRSGFYPTLAATGQLARQGATFFPQNERWSAGVSLTLPFFTGLRDYYGSKSSSALLGTAMANRRNVDLQLLAKLRQAFSTYREAVERLKVDERFYRAASTRAEIARGKYNNGLMTFDDWDTIENDLITREKNRLQSQRDRVVSEAAWEQAQGRGVIP